MRSCMFCRCSHVILFLCRDLCAWAESFGDFDHIFEGRRVMLIFEIKKLEELTRRGISSCESPAQVVLRGSISTHFTRLGWFNPKNRALYPPFA